MCKILPIWTKNEENFENLQEKFMIFYLNLHGKLNFHNFLLNISGISASCAKVYTLENDTSFQQQCFPISAGGRSGVPPPDAVEYIFEK